MTLPKDVERAIAGRDEYGLMNDDMWRAVRAHLLSQDAEIVSAHAAELRLSQRAELAESRLAAADALLRQIKDWDVARSLQPTREETLFAIPFELRTRVAAHLQGAGDE